MSPGSIKCTGKKIYNKNFGKRLQRQIGGLDLINISEFIPFTSVQVFVILKMTIKS